MNAHAPNRTWSAAYAESDGDHKRHVTDYGGQKVTDTVLESLREALDRVHIPAFDEGTDDLSGDEACVLNIGARASLFFELNDLRAVGVALTAAIAGVEKLAATIARHEDTIAGLRAFPAIAESDAARRQNADLQAENNRLLERSRADAALAAHYGEKAERLEAERDAAIAAKEKAEAERDEAIITAQECQSFVKIATARADALATTLEWYGENARLCRLIHSGGDAGRKALNDDGGNRARAALTPKESAQ